MSFERQRPGRLILGPVASIAVIIPVYMGGDKLRRCLASLARTEPRPTEIIVVNDGGREDLAYVESEFGARLLELPEQAGPARARNEGVRRSTSDIVLFIDSDVTVGPDIIGRIGASFRDPDVTAVFGSYDDQPAEKNFLSQYRNLMHHYVHQIGRKEASTFWGACGAIRRKEFEALGGFDDSRYPRPSIEDVEFGFRLRKSGKRILLEKSLQVRHLKRWDFSDMIKTDFLRRALPWTDLILRDGYYVNDLSTDTTTRLGVLLSLVLTGGLVAGFWRAEALYLVLLSGLGLLILNAHFYLYLRRLRGTWFALRAIPLHWLFFLLSGTAFAVGVARLLVSWVSAATG